MKQAISLMLALTLALSLAACGGRGSAPEMVEAIPAQPVETAESGESAPESEQGPVYRVETRPVEEEYTADDGTVVGHKRYTLAYLATDGDDAAREAVCKTFNDAMDAFFAQDFAEDSDFASVCRDAYAWQAEAGIEFEPCYDEFGVTDTAMSDTMLSISGAGSSYTGGAHPNNYLAAWNYDLQNGKFFTLNDLAGDPAALRAAVADEILAQIEAQGLAEGYFENYEEVIRGAEDFNVFFGGGRTMTVWFSEYDIAPHAAGIPMFDISYDVLAPYLNDSGAALLQLA